jgi:cobalt-zinc-cadmium efflux system membrane fusion protein
MWTRLVRRPDFIVLVVVAVVTPIILFSLPRLLDVFAPTPTPQAVTVPAGAFVATAEQWSTLRFATAQLESFQDEIRTDGQVASDDDHTTSVFSPYSGNVTRVLVQAGDRVRAGQTLFAIRGAEFIQAQSDLTAALGARATAEVQLKTAQNANTRLHELLKANGAAQKDVQQSDADLQAAKDTQRTAQANLSGVRNRLLMLGQSDAQIVSLAHRPAAEATVASPISGTIMSRSIAPGQTIASVSSGGTTPALVVSDLSALWLVGWLRASDAGKVEPGEAVDVTVAELPGRTYHGKLDYIAPAIDPATHRLNVRATIANTDGALKPQMFAEFTLYGGKADAAVSVPETAIIYEGDTARVWVAASGRTLGLRQIRVGRSIDGRVEVLSGLTAGESVVTSGALFIDRAGSGD